MSTPDLPYDKRFQNLKREVSEQTRVSKLSNEELCREYLKITDGNDEVHVNEMMNRLWPDWKDQQ